MSLTTRLLVSFLAAIGLVLAGFSAATYAVARHHLRDRLRDRVSAVMDTLLAECNALHFVGFFPDGKRALVRDDRQIGVGPGGVIPDGKLLREFDLTTRKVTSVLSSRHDLRAALAPDGKTFATISEYDADRTAVWAYPAKRPVVVLPRVNPTVAPDDLGGGAMTAANIDVRHGLAFSPDSRVLAFGHSNGVVDLIDPATGEVTARLPQRWKPDAMAFSPDGNTFVAAGGSRGEIRVWRKTGDRTPRGSRASPAVRQTARRRARRSGSQRRRGPPPDRPPRVEPRDLERATQVGHGGPLGG